MVAKVHKNPETPKHFGIYFFRDSGIHVAPNDGISAVLEFASFRTTAFPRFRNSRRSGRRHFCDSEIHVIPNDGMSAISESILLKIKRKFLK
jgi:hypothetical protein